MKRKTIVFILGISIVLVGTLVALLLFMNNQSQKLPDDVFQKFGCDRVTLEHRPTDVFCGNPKYYNNPDGIKYEEYYESSGCKEFLQTLPDGITVESYRTVDVELFHKLSVCKDPAKLDAYIQYLKDLKKNS